MGAINPNRPGSTPPPGSEPPKPGTKPDGAPTSEKPQGEGADQAKLDKDQQTVDKNKQADAEAAKADEFDYKDKELEAKQPEKGEVKKVLEKITKEITEGTKRFAEDVVGKSISDTSRDSEVATDESVEKAASDQFGDKETAAEKTRRDSQALIDGYGKKADKVKTQDQSQAEKSQGKAADAQTQQAQANKQSEVNGQKLFDEKSVVGYKEFEGLKAFNQFEKFAGQKVPSEQRQNVATLLTSKTELAQLQRQMAQMQKQPGMDSQKLEALQKQIAALESAIEGITEKLPPDLKDKLLAFEKKGTKEDIDQKAQLKETVKQKGSGKATETGVESKSQNEGEGQSSHDQQGRNQQNAQAKQPAPKLPPSEIAARNSIQISAGSSNRSQEAKDREDKLNTKRLGLAVVIGGVVGAMSAGAAAMLNGDSAKEVHERAVNGWENGKRNALDETSLDGEEISNEEGEVVLLNYEGGGTPLYGIRTANGIEATDVYKSSNETRIPAWRLAKMKEHAGMMREMRSKDINAYGLGLRG